MAIGKKPAIRPGNNKRLKKGTKPECAPGKFAGFPSMNIFQNVVRLSEIPAMPFSRALKTRSPDSSFVRMSRSVSCPTMIRSRGGARGRDNFSPHGKPEIGIFMAGQTEISLVFIGAAVLFLPLFVFLPKIMQQAMKADADAAIEAFGKNEQVKRVFWTLFVAMDGLVLARVVDQSDGAAGGRDDYGDGSVSTLWRIFQNPL